MFSGKNIFNFGVLKSPQAFQNPISTGGVVEENGICSAAFCESAVLRLASSPSPSLLRKSTSPKGRGLGKEMKFAWTAKGSRFGGAGIA